MKIYEILLNFNNEYNAAGAWLSPNGKIYNLPGNMTHDKFIKHLISDFSNLNINDAYNIALNRGWVRITYPLDDTDGYGFSSDKVYSIVKAIKKFLPKILKNKNKVYIDIITKNKKIYGVFKPENFYLLRKFLDTKNISILSKTMTFEKINEKKEILLMGGNVFKNLNLVRIKKEDILPTLIYLAKLLKPIGIDFNYLKNNLMGSTLKKETSGDIDIAIDKEKFNLRDIYNILSKNIDNKLINAKGLKGGQLNIAFPIKNEPKNGYIQIDFILGNPEWLKFSHWSPGSKSKYKGVFISTALGVLAKMLKDYEDFDPKTKERIARVGLAFNLEKGLTRKWKMQKQRGQGLSKVDPDEWETNVKLPPGKQLPPRFTRLNYIDNPEAVVDILLPGIKPSQINTFEKLYNIIKKHPLWKNRIKEFQNRFINAINRSSAIKNDNEINFKDIFNEAIIILKKHI